MSTPVQAAAPPAGQPVPQPKVSLAELDQRFLKDMNDESLDPVARSFAGRMRQVVEHVQLLQAQVSALVRGHQAVMRHMDQGFKRIAQLLGTAPEQQPVQPPGVEQDPSASLPPEPVNAPAPPPTTASPPPTPEPPRPQ